jgi:hypothetical protein
VAAIWSDVIGRPVVYGGNDPTAFEQNMASFMPKWMAYEMRLMAERYVSDGMIPDAGDLERLTGYSAVRSIPIGGSRPGLPRRPDSPATGSVHLLQLSATGPRAGPEGPKQPGAQRAWLFWPSLPGARSGSWILARKRTLALRAISAHSARHRPICSILTQVAIVARDCFGGRVCAAKSEPDRSSEFCADLPLVRHHAAAACNGRATHQSRFG